MSFPTSNGVELSGYIYTGTNTINPKAVIVFVHGFGGTHQWGQYLREFEYLIDNAYLVFSYDNTGCGISQGINIVGLSQSIVDLDHALTFIEHKQKLRILLYGHSWGGFTVVSSILNINHNVVAVVESSGFNSGKEMVLERGKGMVGNLIYVLSPFISLNELIRFGKYSNYTAINGINRSIIPVLIMHSEDDKDVPYKLSIVNKASKITN
ncbi:alpha/beta hydrolase [Clostridium akagii]|uniref:alpha/beta hydrolase n=1 Tax=Clostridium akagii TaxID=91623 RepID=UPI00047BCC1A|nr:alpha/beta fold hydrolase [Clostridium akagii]